MDAGLRVSTLVFYARNFVMKILILALNMEFTLLTLKAATELVLLSSLESTLRK